MSSKKDIAKKEDKIKKIQKELDALPEEQRLTLLEQSIEYSGMLPPPYMLKQFDEIIPNGADRIMSMAEKEAKERQENNKKVLKYNMTGLYLAFSIALLVFIGAFVLAYKGNNTGAAILAGTVFLGVVAAFINGKK